MLDDLKQWLELNKILYSIIEDDIVEIEGFGKLYINDLSEVNSIFKKEKKTGNIVFNLMCDKESLLAENIDKTCFKFGNNWYWYDLKKGFKLNILKYVGNREKNKLNIEYVNLGIHSPYELLNGSCSFQDWISKAKHLNHKCIGLCDKNTMAGTLNLQKECKNSDMQYVIGYTFDLKDGDDLIPVKIYCQTNDGLSNLLRLQKDINVDSETKTVSKNQLILRSPGNVIVFGTLSSEWLIQQDEFVDQLSLVSDVYYQVDPNEYKADRVDRLFLNALKTYFQSERKVNPVLICDTYYRDKSDAKNKLILNKIAEGAAHNQSDEQYFKDIDELYVSFSAIMSDSFDSLSIFKEMCANTLKIANNANAGYETTRNFMPEYDMTPEEKEKYGTRLNMFHMVIEEGFEKLVPKDKVDIYRERVEKEKYVIESTNNVDYFLVQYDTINWANKQNIMTGIARGSGGGCLLLYLMGITKLDPIKYDLIFERFLLPDRSGLYESEVTIVADPVKSSQYVEIEFENKTLLFDKDSIFRVKSNGVETNKYADELESGDEVLFDNRDLIWTIGELSGGKVVAS